MPDSLFTDKTSIVESISKFGYPALARIYDVNSYYLWHIANDPEYRPPRHIARKLGYHLCKPRRRVAINLADAASAAETIRKHGGEAYAREVARLLEDG